MPALLAAARRLLVPATILCCCASAGQASTRDAAALDHLRFHPGSIPLEESTPAPAGLIPVRAEAGHLLLRAPGPENELQRLQQAIAELENREGPLSPALVQQLQSLATALQGQEQHEEALQVLDRAVALSRRDAGLLSVEQIALTRQRITSLQSLGRHEEVGEQSQYLLHLYRQQYGADDPRIAAPLHELGAWHLRNFHQQLLLGSGVANMPPALQQSWEQQAAGKDPFAELRQAQRHFLDGLRLLVEHEAFNDPTLYALEKQLIGTLYINAHRQQVLSDPASYVLGQGQRSGKLARVDTAETRQSREHADGEQAYLRQIGYLRRNPEATVEQLVGVIMELGDWHLLFGRHRDAEQRYREAGELLAKAGIDPSRSAELLHPQVPTVLPGFFDTALSNNTAANDYRGHVDVRIKLNRYGRVGKVELLGSSAGTSKQVEGQLLQLLRQAQFRPTPGRSSSTDVRYHYSW